jgi:DNA polymerase III, delta subunit
MILLGHQKQASVLSHLLSPTPLRGAFGIIGPEGIGRTLFVTQVLNHSGIRVASSSPDLKIVSNEKSILVEDIHDALDWIIKKPLSSSYKVLIVEYGENLTPEAQSMLLKLLEDTPPHALIFLISSAPKYSEAISSRLLFINLFCLSKEDSEKIWAQQNINNAVFKDFWDLAPGQPGLAMKRYSKKYHQLLPIAKKLLVSGVTPIGFLQMQDDLAGLNTKDALAFWQWVIPRLYQAQPNPNNFISKFLGQASETLVKYPNADLGTLLPSLLYSTMMVP